jgi:YggT family protein
MRALLDVILIVLQIYVWLLIAAAILSWLIAFNIVNTQNQVVAMLANFLWQITEPVLRPVRAALPHFAGGRDSDHLPDPEHYRPLYLSQRVLIVGGRPQ